VFQWTMRDLPSLGHNLHPCGLVVFVNLICQKIARVYRNPSVRRGNTYACPYEVSLESGRCTREQSTR
jgi:hypothetical protein